MTCWALWMPSTFQALRWPALTGAGAAPAWWRRCGQSGCVLWSWRMAIPSKTSRPQPCRDRHNRNFERGTNFISIPNAVAPALRPIGASSASYCGGCGPPTGRSMKRPTNALPLHSKIRISSMSSSIRIATVMDTPPVTLTWRSIEQRLAALPPIAAPTIVLSGAGDGVSSGASAASQARFFTGPVQHRVIPLIGHDVPQEAPAAFAGGYSRAHRSRACGRTPSGLIDFAVLHA